MSQPSPSDRVKEATQQLRVLRHRDLCEQVRKQCMSEIAFAIADAKKEQKRASDPSRYHLLESVLSKVHNTILLLPPVPMPEE